MNSPADSHTSWLQYESAALAEGYTCIAGIDEAGRGALAGPVVAACVVLPDGCVPDGVNDSKRLTPEQRAACYSIIVELALGWAVAGAGVEVIDEINILRATHHAMRAALAALPSSLHPDLALIDGLAVLPFPIRQRAIVDGDAQSASIAAASIIAKVTRDRMMTELDTSHPSYHFAQHKGYGTPAHLKALRVNGPCVLHRRSFQPVAVLLGLSAAASTRQLALEALQEAAPAACRQEAPHGA